MMTIWKYDIDPALEAPRPMLAGPVHHVGLDPNRLPCVWIEGDPEAVPVLRSFGVVGTGHPVPDFAWHVGSFLHGPFVWHIYELAREGFDDEPLRPFRS